MINYYHILGVPEDSTENEIKKAFKNLAMRYHPDRNPDDPQAEERFKLINEAYQVLSDAFKRSIYDQWLKTLQENIQTEVYTPTTTSYEFSKQQAPKKPAEKPKHEIKNWQASMMAFAVVGYAFFVHLSISTFYSRLHYFWADKSFKTQNYQEAAEHINSSLGTDKDYARAFFLKGLLDMSYYKAPKAAFENFNQAIQLTENEHLEYYWYRGISACYNKQHRVAENDIQKVIQHYPDSIELYMTAAKTFYEELKDINLSKKYYEKIVQKGVVKEDVYVYLGEIEKKENNIDKALHYYDLAIKTNPKNPKNFYEKAMIYSTKQEMGAACVEWQTAKSMDNNLKDVVLDLFCTNPSEETLIKISQAYNLRKQAQNALPILDSLVKNNSENALVYKERAKSHFLMNNPQKACQDWKKALSIDAYLQDESLQNVCQ